MNGVDENIEEVVELTDADILVEQEDDIPQISIPEESDQDDSQDFQEYVREQPSSIGAGNLNSLTKLQKK